MPTEKGQGSGCVLEPRKGTRLFRDADLSPARPRPASGLRVPPPATQRLVRGAQMPGPSQTKALEAQPMATHPSGAVRPHRVAGETLCPPLPLPQATQTLLHRVAGE
ncbi:uncharacterized protein LOC114670077 isoform X2 [Macaca mulatta]